MKIIQSDFMTAGTGTVTASGANDTPGMVVEHTVKLGDVIEALDVIEFFILPPNYAVHDIKDISDPVDGDDAMTSRVGLLEGEPYDPVFANRTTANAIGSEYLATGKPTVGGFRAPTTAAAYAVPVTKTLRSVGVQVVAAPTDLTVGQKFRLWVELRPL